MANVTTPGLCHRVWNPMCLPRTVGHGDSLHRHAKHHRGEWTHPGCNTAKKHHKHVQLFFKGEGFLMRDFFIPNGHTTGHPGYCRSAVPPQRCLTHSPHRALITARTDGEYLINKPNDSVATSRADNGLIPAKHASSSNNPSNQERKPSCQLHRHRQGTLVYMDLKPSQKCSIDQVHLVPHLPRIFRAQFPPSPIGIL